MMFGSYQIFLIGWRLKGIFLWPGNNFRSILLSWFIFATSTRTSYFDLSDKKKELF